MQSAKEQSATERQKPSCPQRARTAFACKNYCFFWVSVDEVEPDAAGALLPVEPLPAVDPLDALPLGCCVESLEDELLLGAGELGAPLTEPLALVEPPDAESFFVASLDEDALEEGELGVVAEPDTELELEPEGALAGGVVAPEDDEDVEPGWVVRARSPALSPHAVSKLAPKIIDTATAKVESLICWASVVGVQAIAARIAPVRLRS